MSKSKPIGVRFDKNLVELLKKEGKADSYQKILNFLSEFYKINEYADKIVLEIDNIAKNKPKIGTSTSDAVFVCNFGLNAIKTPENDKPAPPVGLSGIDLTIWKAENWK